MAARLPEDFVQRIAEHCKSNVGRMIDLLGQLVSIDSGSYIAEGVNRVGSVVSSRLTQLGFEMDSVDAGEFGRTVVGVRPGRSDKRLLIMGHMDTVFPRGTAASRPFRTEGGRAYGPGVCDAKGGLVTAIYAMSALHDLGWDAAPVAVLFNGHEEVGSKASRRVIEAEAAKSHIVYNLEPARPNGAVVTGRKGVAFLKVECTGKAAHAGVEPEKGINAIEALCHKVIALQKMNDPSRGITVNVDVIEGGTAINVIPDRAQCRVDVRYKVRDDLQPLFERMEEVVAEPSVKGATCRLTWEVLFVPMERTSQVEEAFRLVKKAAGLLGIEITEAFTGGGSDAGFAAATGARVLCGMGPVGGGAHGPDEYLEIPSLAERASLLAASLALAAETP